jgi:hypothetical protein
MRTVIIISKKVLISFCIFFLFSCTSKEEKIRYLVKIDLYDALSDAFHTYEPVTFSSLDSFFTTPQEEELYQTISERLEKLHREMTFSLNQASAWEASLKEENREELIKSKEKIYKCVRDMRVCTNTLDSIEKNFKPQFIGYSVLHEFHAQLPQDESFRLYSKIYVFDQQLTKILRVKDITRQ